MDRYHEACRAAHRILDMIEELELDWTNPHTIIDAFDYYNRPEGMEYSYGASRMVIWDEYCDYVVKIALDERYEKLCQHEVEVYQAAEKEGLEDNFAWCACYIEPCMDSDFYHCGVYVMEYVDCDEDAAYDSAWKYGYETYCRERGLDSTNYNSVSDFDNWNCAEDEEMILDYIESFMDGEKLKAFCVFMMKWWINDIHQANVGFKGGRMVLTDYAGWNW